MRRVTVLVVGGALLLSGCGSQSPADVRQDETADLVSAANNGDAAGLDRAILKLQNTLDSQQASGDISARDANALSGLLNKVRTDEKYLTEPAPTPTPSPTASPTASPTPSPTPSPTASPTPSPTPSATPSATPSPTPSSSPSGTIVIP